MTIYYLYVKTHNITGLKYLGYTTQQDPYSYKGSGLYWKRHLKTHGNDVTTKIILETVDVEELMALSQKYSETWNIVESTEWANLIPELGRGGFRMDVQDKAQAARIAKFGCAAGQMHTTESFEKAAASRLRKYGSKMGACNSDEANAKKQITKIDLYGGAWGAANTEAARVKAKETRFQKYGTAYSTPLSEADQSAKMKKIASALSIRYATLNARESVVQLRMLAKQHNVKLGSNWHLKPSEWVETRLTELKESLGTGLPS